MENRLEDIKLTNLEKKLKRNISILSYLINNNLMYFCKTLSEKKDIDITINLIKFFQIIFYFYMNTCDEISKHNLFNLLNKPKMTEKFVNHEEDINKLNLVDYNDIKLNIYNNLYNHKKNNNLENENKDLTDDLIKIISIVIYKFDEKQK
jgi:hypothetical protein